MEEENNPYTLLATIFVVADSFEWRKYIGHMAILIKKFNNLVESSKGKVLEEIIRIQGTDGTIAGYSFQ